MEIELKLPITDKKEIIKKLTQLGAKFISETKQIDYLFNSSYFNFAKKDEAFRLRHEIFPGGEKAYITYKGKARFSKAGHKKRDEYEVEVSDFHKMMQIIESLRFTLALKVEKIRSTYHLNDIIIAVDTLPFGDFLELEGDPAKSQTLRQDLGLANVSAMKKAYYHLQEEWEKKISQ